MPWIWGKLLIRRRLAGFFFLAAFSSSTNYPRVRLQKKARGAQLPTSPTYDDINPGWHSAAAGITRRIEKKFLLWNHSRLISKTTYESILDRIATLMSSFYWVSDWICKWRGCVLTCLPGMHPYANMASENQRQLTLLEDNLPTGSEFLLCEAITRNHENIPNPNIARRTSANYSANGGAIWRTKTMVWWRWMDCHFSSEIEEYLFISLPLVALGHSLFAWRALSERAVIFSSTSNELSNSNNSRRTQTKHSPQESTMEQGLPEAHHLHEANPWTRWRRRKEVPGRDVQEHHITSASSFLRLQALH